MWHTPVDFPVRAISVSCFTGTMGLRRMNIGKRFYSFMICFDFVMVNWIIWLGIIAVVDEKYFYHCFISPSFTPECPVVQGILGVL